MVQPHTSITWCLLLTLGQCWPKLNTFPIPMPNNSQKIHFMMKKLIPDVECGEFSNGFHVYFDHRWSHINLVA